MMYNVILTDTQYLDQTDIAIILLILFDSGEFEPNE